MIKNSKCFLFTNIEDGRLAKGRSRFNSNPGAVVTLLLLVTLSPQSMHAQGFANFNKAQAQIMLQTLKNELEKNYYDSTIRRAALDELFKESEAKIEGASSSSQLLGIIAQTLITFDDSHTFFIPPERANEFEYGWQLQMVGDNCFIVAVKPGTDAETKGVKVGDQVLAVDGFAPTRATIWRFITPIIRSAQDPSFILNYKAQAVRRASWTSQPKYPRAASLQPSFG